MSGDWIKMRSSLRDDPAVVRIASALNADRFSVVGRLHCVWSWAQAQSIDGQSVDVDSGFLDELVSQPGFSAEMEAVGWLEIADNCVSFPSFSRHNGSSAKRRAMEATRKAKGRIPSAFDADGMRTREEKRREEKKQSNHKAAKAGAKITNRPTRVVKKKKFIPPTISEVRKYIAEKGLRVDAEAFLNHYESNGWRVGKNSMVCWKASIRNAKNWSSNRQGASASPKTIQEGKSVASLRDVRYSPHGTPG